MELEKANSPKNKATIDIVKLIMAFLVVDIHTEPFGGIFWLDKGFGIITRMCVPFFSWPVATSFSARKVILSNTLSGCSFCTPCGL